MIAGCVFPATGLQQGAGKKPGRQDPRCEERQLEGCGRLSALLVLQSIRAEGGQEEWCAPPAAREGKLCLSEPFPLLAVGFPRDVLKGYDGKGAHRLCLVHLIFPQIPAAG